MCFIQLKFLIFFQLKLYSRFFQQLIRSKKKNINWANKVKKSEKLVCANPLKSKFRQSFSSTWYIYNPWHIIHFNSFWGCLLKYVFQLKLNSFLINMAIHDFCSFKNVFLLTLIIFRDLWWLRKNVSEKNYYEILFDTLIICI